MIMLKRALKVKRSKSDCCASKLVNIVANNIDKGEIQNGINYSR